MNFVTLMPQIGGKYLLNFTFLPPPFYIKNEIPVCRKQEHVMLPSTVPDDTVDKRPAPVCKAGQRLYPRQG